MPIEINTTNTVLQKIQESTCYFPLYMNIATKSNDPLERFKLTICAIVGGMAYSNCFKKPVNL